MLALYACNSIWILHVMPPSRWAQLLRPNALPLQAEPPNASRNIAGTLRREATSRHVACPEYPLPRDSPAWKSTRTDHDEHDQ